MRYRYAKNLNDGDQVEVRIERKTLDWVPGVVRGVPRLIEVEGQKVVELTVDCEEYGLLFGIPHTAIR